MTVTTTRIRTSNEGEAFVHSIIQEAWIDGRPMTVYGRFCTARYGIRPVSCTAVEGGVQAIDSTVTRPVQVQL